MSGVGAWVGRIGVDTVGGEQKKRQKSQKSYVDLGGGEIINKIINNSCRNMN